MSTDSRPLDQLIDQYPHRELETVETDIKAQKILEGYIENRGVEHYSSLDSEFPYQATLGRMADTEGEIILTSHYTYPQDTGFEKDQTQAQLDNLENMVTVVEENIIDESKILDSAGVEFTDGVEAATSNGTYMHPNTAHCIVFYDKPVVSAIKETEYDGPVHKQAAMQSLTEPSLATAIINVGREPSGENFAGMQVDYWTRTIDDIDGGLDYTDLDWENPGE